VVAPVERVPHLDGGFQQHVALLLGCHAAPPSRSMRSRAQPTNSGSP
jgi:hypothetical protein